MLANIISTFVLGLIGGANPGPILLFSCAESLRVGFKKSLRVIFWALISESIVAAVILILVSFLNPNSIVYSYISLVGGVYLAYLAWQVYKLKGIGEGTTEVFNFKKIFIITLLNGPFWFFWITICVPLAAKLSSVTTFGYWLFLLFFEIGWLVSTTILVFPFSRFRNFLTKGKMIGVVYKIFGIILLYFSIKLLISALTKIFI
ncbi:MAG: LysE family transporter [Candidatus Buchananbacteria bacterium]|nr:LysE family transporter [Candidatus Buchananbacteria bacterium]